MQHLPIRSYVLRQGRITQAQQRAWQEHSARYVLPEFPDLPDWQAIFGRRTTQVVEIGCGYGETTCALAKANPQIDYIAFEVHRPAVGALMNRLAAAEIENVRIANTDALATIAEWFEDESVAAFNIFFPDPWRKKKHHKRRLIRPEVLSLLLSKLVPQGGVHFVSDWQHYAESAAAVFAATPALCPAPPPSRGGITRFEARAIAAGRAVHEFYFVKQ